MRGVWPSASTHGGCGMRSALGIAQGGTVNANRVALMAEPAEEGLDEGFVAEKGLPFRVIEVRCNNRGLATVALLHQLKEDVGLFRF